MGSGFKSGALKVAGVLMTAVLLTACGGGASSSSSSSGSSSSSTGSTSTSTGSTSSSSSSGSTSQTLTPVTIGLALVPPKMTFIGFYVARDQGFFKKEGLNVSLVSFNNGVQSLQGLAGGHTDFGATATSDVLAAADKGGNVKAVWSYGVPLDTTLVTPSSITKVSQLKGKTLAWSGPGGFAQLNIDAALKAGGVAYNAVHYVTMNRPGFVPAIVSGKVQGAIFHADDGYNAQLKDPHLHILTKIYNVLPNWWYGALAVTTTYAKAHASTVEKVITAMDLADRWMYQHPNQTIAIGVKYTKEPKAAVQSAYKYLSANHEWTVNTGLETGPINYTIQGEAKLGWTKTKLTYNSVADPTYANAVVAKIGKANFGY